MRATADGNMILVSEYIFIFPEPACYKCFIISNETKKTHTCKILFKINIQEKTSWPIRNMALKSTLIYFYLHL
jgi:hypothetical protein